MQAAKRLFRFTHRDGWEDSLTQAAMSKNERAEQLVGMTVPIVEHDRGIGQLVELRK